MIIDEMEYIYSPKLSRNDVDLALEYARNQISIPAEEVGTAVYNELLFEKIREYLTDI